MRSFVRAAVAIAAVVAATACAGRQVAPAEEERSLRCVIDGGRIRDYRFFEDSAAFVEASR